MSFQLFRLHTCLHCKILQRKVVSEESFKIIFGKKSPYCFALFFLFSSLVTALFIRYNKCKGSLCMYAVIQLAYGDRQMFI